MRRDKTAPAHPNKRKPFFRFIRGILRTVKPRCRVLDMTDGQGRPGIFLSNHSAATGPLMVELNLPYAHHPWGAYQMNGNIRERFRYLYHVFFRQKKKMRKVPAFLLASIACCLSKGIYKGMGLISSYPDLRILRTLNASVDYLDRGVSVVIYPEDSSEGYKEYIEKFHGGFCLLSSLYYARRGVDLPVYSMYYSDTHHRLVISRPSYVRPMIEAGMTREEICAYFRDKTNRLYTESILPEAAAESETSPSPVAVGRPPDVPAFDRPAPPPPHFVPKAPLRSRRDRVALR